MPLSKYFGGSGEKVAASMKKKYGKRWKSVFYATANKQAQTKHSVSRGMRKRDA